MSDKAEKQAAKELGFAFLSEFLKNICEQNIDNCNECPLLIGCEEPHFEVKDENKSV